MKNMFDKRKAMLRRQCGSVRYTPHARERLPETVRLWAGFHAVKGTRKNSEDHINS